MAFTLADTLQPGAPTPSVQHYTEQVSGGTLHVVLVFSGGGNLVGITSSVVSSGITNARAVNSLTTVGAGTLTAALLLAGTIQRSGPTGAFTDTTDTAAAIQAAWGGGGVGNSFAAVYQNLTAFNATLAAGTGVTLTGSSIVPPNSWANILFVWTGVSTISAYVLETGSLYGGLPQNQYTTSSVTTGSIAAGIITGSQNNVWLQTGATPGAQLVRTAAQLLADMPNGQVGQTQRFRIINSGSGTLTLTTDAGATVTLSGTMTVAQNTWRDFILTFLTATTASIQSIGTGTNS